MVAVLAAVSCSFSVSADELSEISNYREYSPTFSSSGQPTKEQLQLLKDDGFERIVYIAFSNNGNAFADEDVLVSIGEQWVLMVKSTFPPPSSWIAACNFGIISGN